MSEPTAPELPVITDETLERSERIVFAKIRQERERRARRRRTAWVGTGAAAAIIVVAAVIAPSVGGLVGGAGGGSVTDGSYESAPDAPVVSPDEGATDGGDQAGGLATEEGAPDSDLDREIIASASVNLRVDDVAIAAKEVGTLATDAGGWVESMSVGTSGQEPMPIDSMDQMTTDAPAAGYGWVTVRVPADELTVVVAQLEEVGEVAGVTIDRQDVTEQAVDLRARIEALQASVDRLTELMTQSASVADLIAAETALSERQAELESYQQQLESLEGQVAMSTLSVSLSLKTVTVTADPAGFTDGWAAGWNTLVASLNGFVIALGFLIPWIIAIAVVGAIAWGIVRLVKRSRRPQPPDTA